MVKIAYVLSILILLNSCYTYQQLNTENPDYVVGKRYEIRMGDRKMEKVLIVAVTDSTLVVVQDNTEMTIQKSMITESRIRKYSVGRTIVASALGALVVIATIGIISWNSGSNEPFFVCC
ncbi:hypothetical protein [Flagellimonas olearia]|uniref:Uncharacterized protein n=1 Tax=Flagellimonas olearia TaxID=552546 RepID=A0A444VPE9_9FLAO|nr:hypothetical protein [Allomuricauda olearia]RYC52589.1 hypothetical protein DN53_07625 [Allomuricauda olearia]